MGYYRTAQICEDGHTVNPNIEEYPETNQKFCDKCGQSTITKCPSCQTSIRGEYVIEGIVNCTPYEVPPFCYNCGNPYPSIQNSIDGMMELMELEASFNESEKQEMQKALLDISNDSSRTEIGVLKVKKMYKKISPTTKNIFTNIVVNIATEKAKQELGL